MIRTVIVNGHKYSIDQQNVLGTGGEATVVRVNDSGGSWAVKIYHTADFARVEKIKAFVGSSLSLPTNVYAPQHLAFDTKKKIVGFAMNLIPKGYEVVQMLSSKKFRRANPAFNSQFVTDLFIGDYETTESLHAANIVIGDNNDLNKMFDMRSPQSAFIDVDSFQIGRFPCMVGTETYLDPSLFNIDLSAKCHFKTEHDWYAFWAMYIKSLIMVHPYGGVHNQYRSIPQRALAKVTIFDSSVKYPKSALNIDLLSDALKGITERIFARGERFKPDIAILREYRDSLVECKSCGTWHPGEQNHCPQCSTINTQQIQRQVNVVKAPGNRTVNCEQMLSTPGNFVWSKLHGSEVYAIAREGSEYVLYAKSRNVNRRLPLFPTNGTNPRFDLFAGRYLVVSKDQLNSGITVYDTSGTLREMEQSVCDQFHGRRTFACSKDHLVRARNGVLYRGSVDPILKKYMETKLFDVMQNQTWFVASPLDGTIFGFERFFSNMSVFVVRFENNRTFRHDVKMPQFDQHETILSVSVRFAVTSVLFLMKTEIKGKTYTRVFVIKINGGDIISHYRVEALSSDTHRNIHGKAFGKPSGMNGIILHATDDGVVQEIIGANRIDKQSLLSETEQFVAEGDSLSQYQSGILVAGDSTINYLTIV